MGNERLDHHCYDCVVWLALMEEVMHAIASVGLDLPWGICSRRLASSWMGVGSVYHDSHILIICWMGPWRGRVNIFLGSRQWFIPSSSIRLRKDSNSQMSQPGEIRSVIDWHSRDVWWRRWGTGHGSIRVHECVSRGVVAMSARPMCEVLK